MNHNFNFKFKYITRQNKPDLHISIAEGEIAQKTIVIVPGIGWHGGFYYPLLNILRDAGYRAIAVDLRGHGKSKGERGEHLYEELIEDVSDTVTHTISEYGEDVYLLGTSFGASVAYYAAIKNLKLKGLILNNAWDINNLPPTINMKRINRKLDKYSSEPLKMVPLVTMMGIKVSWNLFDNKLEFLTLLRDKLWHKKWSIQSWKSFIF